MRVAGRAVRLGRILLFLSLRYLKIEYLKIYVGGLVYFDGSTSVYRALKEWLFGRY